MSRRLYIGSDDAGRSGKAVRRIYDGRRMGQKSAILSSVSAVVVLGQVRYSLLKEQVSSCPRSDN